MKDKNRQYTPSQLIDSYLIPPNKNVDGPILLPSNPTSQLYYNTNLLSSSSIQTPNNKNQVPFQTKMPTTIQFLSQTQNSRRRNPSRGHKSPCKIQIQTQLHPCSRSFQKSRPPIPRLPTPPSRQPRKHPQYFLPLQIPNQHLLRCLRHNSSNHT